MGIFRRTKIHRCLHNPNHYLDNFIPTVAMVDINYIDVLCAFLGIFILNKLARRTRRGPLPPGPKPLPLIGNLLDMPKEKDWKTYHTWNKQYGDVAYIKVFGSRMIFLSSVAVINDLLERRSAIYSDRPTSAMAVELCGGFS